MIQVCRSVLVSIILILFNHQVTGETIYMWSGAITPVSARVNAKLQASAPTQARIAASTNQDLSNPIYGPFVTANAGNNYMAAMSINSLVPNTKYFYAIEANAILDNSSDDIGSFTTPRAGAQSFRFVVGSCNLSSAHAVFNNMAEKNPLLEVITGDFHYANPNSSTNINVHRMPYETNMLSQLASRNFHLKYPLAYIWDDHDYCGDNTGASATGRMNARLAYQEYVPHYPLAAGSGDVPIYQSFTIGRIHFILSDLRSMRGTGNTSSTDPNLSMMGTVQKQWFKNQCLYAKGNNLIIAWVTSVSYGGNQSDNWAGFPEERKELANFFKANNIENMFLLSGDAHMAAIDNGSNHDYATGGSIYDYPVLQAAAMNQSGGYKGGTYSEVGPVLPNGANNSYINPNSTFGQYAVVDVTDVGSTQVTISFSAYRVTNTGTEQMLVSYIFQRNLLAVAVPIKISSFVLKSDPGNNNCVLKWNATFDHCREFTIERSGNGIQFNALATVDCSTNTKYQYSDRYPLPGLNYYRIKGIDQNGVVTYSSIEKGFVGSAMEFSLAPNPAKKMIRIAIENVSIDNGGSYAIFDTEMRLIQQGKVNLKAGSNQVEIRLVKKTPGLYFIRVVLKDKQLLRKFIID